MSNITQLKEKVLWYTFDGEGGVILGDVCNEFVPFSKLSQEQVDDLLSGDIQYHCAIQDAYHFDSYEKGLALETGPITNPENDQKLLYNEYSLKGCQEADRYEREYIRTGGKYYDWNSAPLMVHHEHGPDMVLNRDRLEEARKDYRALSPEAKKWVDLGEHEELITTDHISWV